jgi:cytochrome c-type biogenesis protein CcmH
MVNILLRSCFLCGVWLFALSAEASIAVYHFAAVDQEQQFQRLTSEIRCPQCQNQSIASSDAPLAKDLKDRVYALVLEGKSDAEIRQYLVERYGDFISYRPTLSPKTGLLWWGPWLMLGVLLLALLAYLTYRRRASPAEMSADEKAQVATLLGIKNEAE